MSRDDDGQDRGRLLTFPRVVLPGSFDAPGPDADPGETDGGSAGPSAPAGVWPRLPGVEEMAPPLALTMPGVPTPDDKDSSGEEEGAFTPPQPEDPDRPTVRDTLALCMALVTALGVAAAQGMWQRARQRAARADEARAHADRAKAKAEGRRKSEAGSSGSRGSSALRSTGSSRRDGDSSGHGRRRRRGGKDRPDEHSTRQRKPGPGKAPKARRDGKKPRKDRKRAEKDRLKTRDSDRRAKPEEPKKPHKPKSRKVRKLRWKAPKIRPGGKQGKGDRPKGWTSGRPGAGRKHGKDRDSKAGNGKVSWKAPKRGKPGPGQAKAIAGRRRWSRVKDSQRRKHGKRRVSWVRRAWKGRPKWVSGRQRRWTFIRRPRIRRPRWRWSWSAWEQSRGRSWLRSWSSRRRARHGHEAGGAEWFSAEETTAPPPPPPPGPGGMRPPPAADRTVWVTSERVDDSAPPRPSREPLLLTGAPRPPHLALPPAAASPPATTNGAHPVNTSPIRSTQYAEDSELTVYDVIEADADMAEEILAGVEEAKATADGCEQLVTKLEAVSARIIELKVPGLLAGWMVRLLEKTATVKARAEAIADRLPAASEAIAVAGSNAAAIYKPPADVTRDMGHARPAERDYHNE